MVQAGSCEKSEISRTELDSHASSIVVGKNVLVTHDTGKVVNVGPFTDQLGKLKDVPIVDCVVAHDCPYSKRTFFLAMYNTLYIPKMNENLVPPFTLRRQGNVVNDIPKIQLDAPSEMDHCIILDDNRIHIPLQLIGTMSYFKTRMTSIDEYEEAVLKNNLVDMDVNEPDWDPMGPKFARDEARMLDYEGRIVEHGPRERELFDMDMIDNGDYNLSKVNVMKEDDKLVARISALSVNDGMAQKPPDNKHMPRWELPVLKQISRSLDPVSFATDVVESAALSKYQSSMKSRISSISISNKSGIKPEEFLQGL